MAPDWEVVSAVGALATPLVVLFLGFVLTRRQSRSQELRKHDGLLPIVDADAQRPDVLHDLHRKLAGSAPATRRAAQARAGPGVPLRPSPLQRSRQARVRHLHGPLLQDVQRVGKRPTDRQQRLSAPSVVAVARRLAAQLDATSCTRTTDQSQAPSSSRSDRRTTRWSGRWSSISTWLERVVSTPQPRSRSTPTQRLVTTSRAARKAKGPRTWVPTRSMT